VQRSTNYIVKGNHTWKAAKKLGWENIDVLVLDMDDATARAYLIADNATADRATYDESALLEVLKTSLSNLEGTGFTEDDFETLSEKVHAVPEPDAPRPRVEIEIEEPDEEDDSGPVPTREITFRIPAAGVSSFAEKANDLVALWKLSTLAEVVLRSVDEAHERWKANVGVTGKKLSSIDVIPENLVARSDF
jgi:hypothetical protein